MQDFCGIILHYMTRETLGEGRGEEGRSTLVLTNREGVWCGMSGMEMRHDRSESRVRFLVLFWGSCEVKL